ESQESGCQWPIWNVLAIHARRPGSKPRNIGFSTTLARSSKLTKPFPSVTRNAAPVRRATPNAHRRAARASAIAGRRKHHVGLGERRAGAAARVDVAEPLERAADALRHARGMR